jgi:hypothetical protein
MFAVFRKGRWIEYPAASTDARWTDVQRWEAAAVYGTAIAQGMSQEKALSLSEAYVFKTLYPGLQYSSATEVDLSRITRE